MSSSFLKLATLLLTAFWALSQAALGEPSTERPGLSGALAKALDCDTGDTGDVCDKEAHSSGGEGASALHALQRSSAAKERLTDSSRRTEEISSASESLRLGGLIDLANFTKLWERKQAEEEQKRPKPTGPWRTKPTGGPGPLNFKFKLVLGVFSTATAKDAAYQDVIRKTWMTQLAVCPLADGPDEECSVYASFVVGAQGNTQPVWGTGKELILGIKENMDNGKSAAFFKFAAENFTWATYIGKMDLDTFPYLYSLMASLRDNSKPSCESYVGECVELDAFTGGALFPSPPGCSHPVNGDFLTCSNTVRCLYMGGGLYVMSLGLAQGLTLPGSSSWAHWEHRSGWEDMITGRVVKRYAELTRCVAVWEPEAWYHLGSEQKKLQYSGA